MDTALTVLSLWLHGLATAMMLGFYLLLESIFLPYLEGQAGRDGVGGALHKIYGRFMPFVAVAFIIFVVTGIYLMLKDPHYPGFGNIFANAWAISMAVKHVVVIVMLGLGGWLYTALRRGNGQAGQVKSVKVALGAMNVCGVTVLLLTAIAQSL